MNFDKIVRENTMKTYLVLALYIAVLTIVGLLVDIVRINAPTLESGFISLISFETTPIVTLIMFAISVLIMFFSLSNFKRIMLSGSEYKEIINPTSHIEQKAQKAFFAMLRAANFNHQPRFYIIYAPYMNAFASGWNEQNSLVCVTSALVEAMNDEELEAVIAHELSHIRHGDIKLTMCVGILANVLMLASNFAVYMFMGRNNNEGANKARTILLVLQFILPLLTLWLNAFLSRSREYMADGGSAFIMGSPKPLISALQKIQNNYENNDFKEIDSNPTRQAAYIFGDALSSHPSLNNRIKSLLAR